MTKNTTTDKNALVVLYLLGDILGGFNSTDIKDNVTAIAEVREFIV